MAINSEEKAAKARELLVKLQSATDLMPEEAERTNANIDRLRAALGEYEQSSRQVDQSGRLTSDVPGYEQEEEDLEDGGFFYEPSVESVKERLRSDPSLSERLNLRSWTSSPDQIERLTEHDTAYSAVADEDYKIANEQARQGKKKLTRYSKVKLAEDPLSKATGFVGKHLPAFATGVTEAILPFQQSSSTNTAEFLDELNASQGRNTDYANQYKDTRSSAVDASPTAKLVGTFAGAASPMSVGSMAATGAMKVGNYAARSPLGKAAIGAVGGALGSVAEGELQAADQEMSQEDPELQNYFDGIRERVTGNAIFGGALGAGGDLLSQAAKSASESLRNFSPAVAGLRELENAGGNLRIPMGPGSIISPVKVPDEVMDNFRASAVHGEVMSPLEIAANKVGPQIAESVDQQAQEAYRQAGESLEKYHRSPQGMSPKRVTKPARVMLDMIREGKNQGDFGTVGDTVPKIAKKLRERLMNEVERKDVSLEEYDNLKARYGDDIIELDPNDADFVLGEDTQAFGQGDISDKAVSPHIGRQEPFAMASEPSVANADVIAKPQDVGTIRPGGGDIPGVGPGQPELQNPFRAASDIPVKPPAVDEFGAPLEVGDYTVFSDEDMPGLGPPARAPHNPFQPMHVNALIPQGFLEIDGPAAKAASVPPKPNTPVPAPEANIREAGTVPPKGKQKKPSGKVAGPAERDITPTNLYESSNAARNEYGEKMRPYREAMRASDMRTENLMEEFPYVNPDPNVNPSYETDPSAAEIAGTKRAEPNEFEKSSTVPAEVKEFIKDNKGTIAGIAAVSGVAAAGEEDAAAVGAGVIGLGKGRKGFRAKSGKSYPKGTKTVLVPRARNSRQIEKIQQDIAEDLQGISKDSDWLKKVDKAFRETRDQFEPNEFTPGEMILDDGTKVTGLSALQRKHHELLQQIDEMKADTSSKSKTAILNKIKAFASGQNGTADKELLEQAKKLGLEKELREVAATRVVPGLKRSGSPLENEKGIFTGLKNAGIQRILPVIEAVGNVPGNPFVAAPNTPAARIQQYLFENAAKNLLNFEGGRLGRFGNEARNLTEEDK